MNQIFNFLIEIFRKNLGKLLLSKIGDYIIIRWIRESNSLRSLYIKKNLNLADRMLVFSFQYVFVNLKILK